MNELKKNRLELNITQEEAARLLNISRRTYQKYETIENNDPKLDYYVFKFKELNKVDENTGLLSIDKIKAVVSSIMSKYKIKTCYLFGSYAKDKASPSSDIDLLIDFDITGLSYYGLVEELREKLHKKVDLLTLKSIENNAQLMYEILKDGIKI